MLLYSSLFGSDMSYQTSVFVGLKFYYWHNSRGEKLLICGAQESLVSSASSAVLNIKPIDRIQALAEIWTGPNQTGPDGPGLMEWHHCQRFCQI